MKLLDLLVKELPQRGGWPCSALSIAQDSEGVCWGYNCDHLTLQPHGWWRSKSGDAICTDGIKINEIASDWDTTFITRAQYESALAASDGWIEWGGGECPVEDGAIVDLRDRDGYLWLGAEALLSTEAKANFWRHTGVRAQSSDIIAYRLHKPDLNSRANDDRLEQDLNECIGQGVEAEWDGKGLPPVGCECEYVHGLLAAAKNDNKPKSNTIVRVVAHQYYNYRDVCVCVWINAEGGMRSSVFSPRCLKPLRTEAEKARETACHEIASLIGRGTFFEDAERIYDAGYRKENK